MAIVLDTTTRGEYLALTTASSRASLVVSALPAPVYCEVRDGQDVLRASGTMEGQWATASAPTLTVGEVDAQGINVTAGGAPDGDWYCQFRSGTRFVRGTFGVLGSGRDFVWSLTSFSTGSRGAIGAVSIAVTGTALPAVVNLPVISGTAQVGSTLSLGTGTWTNSPTSYTRTWRNGATQIAGNVSTYALTTADLGRTITGDVVATNASGSTLASSIPVGPVVAAGDPSGLPLVQQSDLEYLGAFRVPSSDNYGFGGFALGFNAAGNGGLGSLYMAGPLGRTMGEFSIPALVNATGTNNLASLNFASRIQAPVDAGNSEFTAEMVPEQGGARVFFGAYPYNGALITAVSGPYVTSDFPQTKSHLRRPLTLTDTSNYSLRAVAGPSPYQNLRYFAGYMMNVPQEWRALLGAPAITGNVASSIVSNASDGPSALAFDPDALIAGDIVGQPLMHYPANTLFDWPANVNTGVTATLWNHTGVVGGGCIPNGTRTIAFFGTLGVGQITYGPGGSTPVSGNGPWAYDPTNNSNGEHAYPYRYYCWLYDLNDIVARKNAGTTTGTLRPYSYFDFTMPFEGTRESPWPGGTDPDPDSHNLGGVAYDPATRRVYIVQGAGGYGARAPGGTPIIHVFRVNSATPA
jgi:hypothetical protein